MEYDSKTIANITADGTTGPIDVQDICEGLGFTLTGDFGTGGSVQPQISLDAASADFVNEGPAISAASERIALPPCAEVQFVTTGSTTPVILVRLGGVRSTARHD